MPEHVGLVYNLLSITKLYILLNLCCVLSVLFFVDKTPPKILRVLNKLFSSHWMLENDLTRWSKDFKFGRKFHCKD